MKLLTRILNLLEDKIVPLRLIYKTGMKILKTISFFVVLTLGLMSLVACNEEDTYAEMRERERDQVQAFLEKGTRVVDDLTGEVLLDVPGAIKVITEDEFYANDSTTDVSKNEYVLFSGSGVYMQIIRKGTGKKIKEGESCTVLNRYVEFNIAADSITTTNRALAFETMVDKMTCTNSYGTITASFLSGVMSSVYGSAAVPSGWLIPLHFIGLGRQDSEDAEIALVRLIVPSTEGQADASTNVYPCFYEISYQKGR